MVSVQNSIDWPPTQLPPSALDGKLHTVVVPAPPPPSSPPHTVSPHCPSQLWLVHVPIAWPADSQLDDVSICAQLVDIAAEQLKDPPGRMQLR